MSKGWETFLGISIALILLVVFMLILGVIALSVGLIAQFFGFETNHNTIELGFGIMTTGGFLAVVIYFIAKFLASITLSLTSFVKERYEGKPMKCKIFEECKDATEEGH